ncbi:hypothetical protein F2Q69_00034513 [Brassica cretica]|uniref:Uncharacterized protein n=1 Tax=Brassica cretica TaxID=69181 RepID=A0A8S9SBG3_BRACR|nr:hypothetical protein F2Q69_00034513 [Brassica cretica]
MEIELSAMTHPGWAHAGSRSRAHNEPDRHSDMGRRTRGDLPARMKWSRSTFQRELGSRGLWPMTSTRVETFP